LLSQLKQSSVRGSATLARLRGGAAGEILRAMTGVNPYAEGENALAPVGKEKEPGKGLLGSENVRDIR